MRLAAVSLLTASLAAALAIPAAVANDDETKAEIELVPCLQLGGDELRASGEVKLEGGHGEIKLEGVPEELVGETLVLVTASEVVASFVVDEIAGIEAGWVDDEPVGGGDWLVITEEAFRIDPSTAAVLFASDDSRC